VTWLEKLKNRWGVNSGWQVLIILLVFACTGFSVMYTKRGLVQLFNIENTWSRWIINLFVVLPLYQVILLIYGWLFGQFSFFWNFEKKMFRRLRSIFFSQKS